MPPTSKDLDVNTSSAQSGSSTANSADGRPQPVALEVPVTVNGARTVEGSDKREPFSESTQTVLVFGNGAVIRLASSVAAGQLLFLTNDKTKKEVVCQVVKSKNYRSVSGYVELEFTEAVSGFWGMRFPGERLVAQPSASAPAAPKSPIAPSVAPPKVEAPAASALPKRPESQPLPAPPARTETLTTSALKSEAKPALNLPRIADLKVSNAQPKTPVLPNSFGSSVTTSSRVPEVKPQAPVAPPIAPPVSNPPITNKVPLAPAASAGSQPSTDALQRESERLQEQLSSMLFTPQAPAKSVPPAGTPPTANRQASFDAISKVIEMAKPQPPVTKAAAPAKSAPPATRSSLDTEEVKIPSWLEPLARNAAISSHNETLAREEAAQDDDVLVFEVQDVSAPATTQETGSTVLAPEEPALDMALPAEGVRLERGAGKSKKGLPVAIAAGVLLTVAGGTWYVRQSSAPAQQSASAATIPQAASSVPPAQSPAKNPAQQAPASVASNANASSASSAFSQQSPAPVIVQPPPPQAQPLRNALERSAAAELSAFRKLGEPATPKAVEPKRPSLGEVHLAAPAAAHRNTSQDSAAAEPAPSFSGGQVAPSGDAMGGGFGGGSAKQPTAPPAPLPIGGDVKEAHLISSTPPTYPPIARTQRIQGDVHIDALIDASGHVQSMKVVAGPPLLHQAAMEAVHEWKYQPATLNGNAVPMHLTVTVQFRLQ